jgi:hypothetical protein
MARRNFDVPMTRVHRAVFEEEGQKFYAVRERKANQTK